MNKYRLLISCFLVLSCSLVGNTQKSTTPTLVIEKTHFLVDEYIPIKIEGLKKEQLFTLKITSYDRKNRPWIAQANYQANKKGCVDLAKIAPINGDYQGVDGMGLFWSALYNGVPLEEAPQRGTFARRASLTYNTTIELEIEKKIVATKKITRSFPDPKVKETTVTHNGLQGKLFYPEDTAIKGAIIVLAGSDGGITSAEWRAALFAANGIPALALAFFDYETLPEDLIELPLEYVSKAVEHLKVVKGFDKIGIYGFSKGSELTLSYASFVANNGLDALIACSPSAYVWQGINRKVDVKSSWTLDGQPLPFVPWQYNQEVIQMLSARGPKQFRQLYGFSLQSPKNKEALAKARIPVENIKVPSLFIAGTEDGSWPATDMAQLMVNSIKKNNPKQQVEFLSYPKVGHLIYADYLPATDSERQSGQIFGGNIAANAHARSDSWQKIKAFFKQHLK